MENTKQVLIAENDKTIRTALTMVLQEIGLKVFAVDNGVSAMGNIRTREINLVITNLLLPQLNGVDLIKNTQTTHPHTEIVVLSDVVNDAVYELMRKLGVFRLFQIPFKIDDIKDAVLRGLASNREERLTTQIPLLHEFMQDFIRIVVAHPDIDVFEKILGIGLAAGWTVDHAQNAEEFTKLLTIGFYDILVSSESFSKALNRNDLHTLTQSSCKPVLFILSDVPNSSKVRNVAFASSVLYLPEGFEKNTFIKVLQEALPEYLDKKEKYSLEQELKQCRKVTPGSFVFCLKRRLRKAMGPVFILYCIMILLAGLAGFWISTMMGRGYKEKEETQQSDMLHKMEQYQEMQKLYEQRGK